MNSPAFKMVLLLRSSDTLSADAFVDAWTRLEREDRTAAPGLLRMAFNAPVTGRVPIENVSEAPFDAALELWWDRKNSAADWVVSPGFRGSWLPERLELLEGLPTAVGGTPSVIWASEIPAPPEAVKVLTLPVAARRLRFSEFVDHWTGEHARLALSGPGTRERVLRLEDTPAPTPLTTLFEGGPYDGVGAITFASMEALAAEFASDHYRDVIAPDEVTFTNSQFSAALLTREVGPV